MKTTLTSAFCPLSTASLGLAALVLLASAPLAPAQTDWGNAVSLDGASQYVRVEGLDLTGIPLTIELWAKRESNGTWDGFVGQGGPTSSNGLFFALRDNDVAVFSFYSGGIYSTETYTDTAWHHWAATYDPVAGRCLYRDGVLITTDTLTDGYTGTGNLYVGLIPFGGLTYFDGQIDDVRIWNVARSAQEIAANLRQPLSGTESNLVAYWKFDETNGIIVADATGNGHEGTLINGAQWTASGVFNTVVTNLADAGPGSLRDLVESANETAYAPTITFDASLSGATLALTNGQIEITSVMSIDASGLTNGMVLSGNTNSRVFKIAATATVTLNSLTLSSGNVSNDSGGAILNSGHLVAVNCLFSNNTARGGDGVTPGTTSNGGGGGGGAGMGGAIFSEGPALALTNCVFMDNRVMGGNGGAGRGTTGYSDPGGNGGGPNGGLGGAVGYPGNPGGYGGGGGGGAGENTTGYAGGTGGFGGGGGGGGAKGGGGDGGVGGAAGLYGGNGGAAHYSDAGGGGGGAGLGGAVFAKLGSAIVVDCAFIANSATNGVGGYGSFGNGNGRPGRGAGAAVFSANAELIQQNNVYSNNVQSSPQFFVNMNAGIQPGWKGKAVWGDYDNDGRLDLFVTHERMPPQLWRNTASGFVDVSLLLPPEPPPDYVVDPDADWGDYDNDGRLDLLLSSGFWGLPDPSQLQIWRNTTSGFIRVDVGLPMTHDGFQADWGDYNNDGRLDIVFTGHADSLNPGFATWVWQNTGTGFTNTNVILPGVGQSYGSGCVEWGDYDNDDLLDILIAGESFSGPIAQLWRNTGNGFTNINAGLPGVMEGAVAWGDYDNDGLLDILLSGNTHTGLIAQVWRNTGSGFTNIHAGLPGVGGSDVAWGDCDNDGLLDILLAGYTESDWVAQVWRNTGNGFTNINAGLPGIGGCSVAWGDYDNDGQLDIVLNGDSYPVGPIMQVWRNHSSTVNTPPPMPTGLAAAPVVGGHQLGWNPGVDVETPADGLTYNVSVGTSSNDWDAVSPQADLANGFRRLPAMGNAQLGPTALVDLPWGVYHWKLQAVDTVFAGSPFADGGTLVVAVETGPSTEISQDSRTLQGLAHPLGSLTTAWFEWGDSASYGLTTSATSLGNGTNALPVSSVVTGWVTGTYHFRLVATNELGLHVGADRVFSLQSEAPVVATLAATNAGPTTVTLQANVNPRWAETRAWFEYGLTTKYGSRTAVTNVGDGLVMSPVHLPLPEALPWMTYHYRIVASNNVGVAFGGDEMVTLPGDSPVPPTISALSDIVLPQGNSTSIVFTASPPNVELNVSCNNPVLLPAGSLVLGGALDTHLLAITPDPNHSGTAQIRVTASDGSQADTGTFNLTVTPPATDPSQLMYLTDAQAVSGEAWRFRLVDLGTASTNYTVECRSDLSPSNTWAIATNVVDLGGGLYEVDTGPSQGDLGFYRVKGIRWLFAGLSPAMITVDEGQTPGVVIEFNGVYSGEVSYRWTDLSGLSHTGSVMVAGTTAAIPLPMPDNTTVGQLQSLLLQLQDGTGFALGTMTSATVTIEENDAEWQGTLQTSMGSLGFVLQINETNGNLYGTLRSDLAGFFPTNAPGLPLAELRVTEDTFTAVATNVPLPALGGSPLFPAAHGVDLRLDAANGQTNQTVSFTSVEGVATAVSVVPGRPYLDTALSGTFRLFKPPVLPSTNNVPLY